MKRRNEFARLLVTAVLLLTVVPVNARQQDAADLAQTGKGQDDPFLRPRAKTCSVGTLKGEYGYLMKGINLNWLQLPAGPIAILGVASYDGEGKVTTTATSIFNGVLVPVNQQGTYTINEDCTGEVIFPLGLYPVVITADGREIRGLQTYPVGVQAPAGAGWVLEGHAKKIAPVPHVDRAFERARSFSCTPGMIAGAYAITLSGAVLNIAGISSGPMSGVSLFRFDPDGTFTTKGRMSFNGAVTALDQVGTYTVQGNCNTVATVAASGRRFQMVFVNGGYEFFAIELPPANVPGMPSQGGVVSAFGQRI